MAMPNATITKTIGRPNGPPRLQTGVPTPILVVRLPLGSVWVNVVNPPLQVGTTTNKAPKMMTRHPAVTSQRSDLLVRQLRNAVVPRRFMLESNGLVGFTPSHQCSLAVNTVGWIFRPAKLLRVCNPSAPDGPKQTLFIEQSLF